MVYRGKYFSPSFFWYWNGYFEFSSQSNISHNLAWILRENGELLTINEWGNEPSPNNQPTISERRGQRIFFCLSQQLSKWTQQFFHMGHTITMQSCKLPYVRSASKQTFPLVSHDYVTCRLIQKKKYGYWFTCHSTCCKTEVGSCVQRTQCNLFKKVKENKLMYVYMYVST